MNNKKKKNMLPALAMAGPVSVWMILFVTIPMLYIIYISFMSRGVFGDVVYKFSTESYKTILNPTYFKVILKSLKAAGITTILCLLLGYPLAYIIAHKPKDTAAKLITLIMIPFWTNSLMRLNSWLLLFQTSGPINNFLVGTGVVKEPITFIYTDGLVQRGQRPKRHYCTVGAAEYFLCLENREIPGVFGVPGVGLRADVYHRHEIYILLHFYHCRRLYVLVCAQLSKEKPALCASPVGCGGFGGGIPELCSHAAA